MKQQQQSGKKGESKPFKKTSGKSNKKPESSQAKLWEKTNFSQTTKPFGCFICIKPHRARDCPKKENLNALIGVEEDHSESEIPTRINPIQLLNAIRAKTHKGLMYVKLAIGAQKVVALVDSGATHNFVLMREATRLGLKLNMDDSKLKA